jgi:cytochrome c-type biogenesis protein CcmH/NrfF
MVESSGIWHSLVMDALLSLLWYLPSVLFGIGTVVTLLAVRRAPAGTEDEDGFHYQTVSNRSLDARQQQSSDTVPPMGVRLA